MLLVIKIRNRSCPGEQRGARLAGAAELRRRRGRDPASCGLADGSSAAVQELVLRLYRKELAPKRPVGLLLASLDDLMELRKADAPLVPQLCTLLKHKSAAVREAALDSLRETGTGAQAAIPDIEPLLKDQAAHVREAAAASLHRIRK